jgi:predicted RNA-binding protein with PIN domain
LYYIIDGYNLFFEMHDADPSDLNRKNFVLLISDLLKQTKYIAEMIFDTPLHHATIFPHTSEKPPLTVAYAPTNLEADDLIVEKLYGIKKPEKITVVTSDRELSSRVRDAGGKVMKSKAFLSLLKRRTKKEKPAEKPHSESSKHSDRLEKIFLDRLKDTNE